VRKFNVTITEHEHLSEDHVFNEVTLAEFFGIERTNLTMSRKRGYMSIPYIIQPSPRRVLYRWSDVKLHLESPFGMRPDYGPRATWDQGD
jgi:hypothetical protein